MTSDQKISFTCSPCGISIDTCTSLKRHWLSDKHTKIARDRWGSESSHDKWHCLVVFSNSKFCSVGVTSYFSGSELPEGTENEGAPLPKNVFWWVDRPQTIFLEYESRESAEKAFFSQNEHFLKTHKDMLLKRASELHDFEWLSLFPIKVVNKLKSKISGGSTSNGTASRKRPFQDDHSNQPKHHSKISKCSIIRLNNYCQERGWELPKLCCSVVGKKKNKKFVCVAYVNGVERAKTSYYMRECNTEILSKRRTAELCLTNLEDGVHVGGQVEGNFEPVKTDGPPLNTEFEELDIPGEDWEETKREVEENWEDDMGWENNGEIRNVKVEERKVNEVEMETGIKSVVKKEDTTLEEEEEEKALAGGQVEGYFEPVKTDGPPLKTEFEKLDISGEDWVEIGGGVARVSKKWAEEMFWGKTEKFHDYILNEKRKAGFVMPVPSTEPKSNDIQERVDMMIRERYSELLEAFRRGGWYDVLV